MEYCLSTKNNDIMNFVNSSKQMAGTRKDHPEWGNPDEKDKHGIYLLIVGN